MWRASRPSSRARSPARPRRRQPAGQRSDLRPGSVRSPRRSSSSWTIKTLAVHVPLDGEPAAGFRVTDINVDPTTLTVQGAPDLLDGLNVLDTAPVSLAGVTQTREQRVQVQLPPGVVLSPSQPKRCKVRVAVEELTTRMTQSVPSAPSGWGPAWRRCSTRTGWRCGSAARSTRCKISTRTASV